MASKPEQPVEGEKAKPEQQEPEKLTAELWRRLYRRTTVMNDTCNIQYSGYHVMARYLLRWQASIYTLLWVDMLIWCCLYVMVTLVYRLALSDDQKTVFEKLVRMVARWSGELPITFLLGFFVSNVVSRWWTMYQMIPQMGGVSSLVRGCVLNSNFAVGLADPTSAERVRRTISRYLNLAWVLCIWQFSDHLKERFTIVRRLVAVVNEVQPEGERERHIEYNKLYNFRGSRDDPIRRRLETIRVSEQMQADNLDLMLEDLCLLNEDPVVKRTYGDLITESEIRVFESQARRLQDIDDNEEDEAAEGASADAFESGGSCCRRRSRTTTMSSGSRKQLYRVQWWLPLHWALALVEKAMEDGFVHDTNTYVSLCNAISEFGDKLTALSNYAGRHLPLVYTQVVIIAVYTMYLSNVMSKQFLDPARTAAQSIDGYWLDYYVPVFALLQIVFVVGWFKVAMVLIDPFGSDEEDFPLGDIFNGNLAAGAEMSANAGDLYPPKLRKIVFPVAMQPAADQDLLSEPEDSQAVLVEWRDTAC